MINSISYSGPSFEVASDKLAIIGGHSERKEVLEFLARTVDSKGIFSDIVIHTLNNMDTSVRGAKIAKSLREATVLTRSAGITRVGVALQVIALNPPERLSVSEQISRAKKILADPIETEAGHHNTGLADMTKAALQIVGSPISTARTMSTIHKGYSTVYRFMQSASDFPAGRAIVHGDLDGFGFYDSSDMNRAARYGVTAVTLHGVHHNEVLFAPGMVIDAIAPIILKR